MTGTKPLQVQPCALQIWGKKLVEAKGAKRARVAVARKRAALLHKLWQTETEFRWSLPQQTQTRSQNPDDLAYCVAVPEPSANRVGDRETSTLSA